ncbi:serine/threonine-protein kinase [Streptomyces sp. B-S-A8]|uniref:Serine/threonine-protein kinase n=1 Tax=Streptomyces solicavernae TaxID=3043614 RepID=A0ABT6RUG8_9ACTN|nr:serine/threonine-protein kinase [Streptomyces sp. B-S-A8]MDI3388030.1 serine/threonine-protein kinase [Streptomyces sp. B-S-A8]
MEQLAPDEPREIAGYRLQGRLGQGGMGVVYLSHTRGGQPVALKVVRREYAQDPLFKERFGQEVAAARRVQGPYTAPVLDSRTEDGELWLATAYVPGPPLSEAVSRHGALPLRTVLQLAGGVAEALQTIHGAGIVHRDLKPSNVLLGADGPRVIDFGIARAADTAALTGTGVALGTPAYMAPEQATGGDITPALDVFALGLVLHYAATGTHAYGEGPSQAILHRIVANEPQLDGCPQELRGLVESCLSRDPATRPSPAEIVEHCHAAAGAAGLGRAEGWWLPPDLAQAVEQQEHTMRIAPSAPQQSPDQQSPDQQAPPQQPPPAAPVAHLPTQPPQPPAFGPSAPPPPQHAAPVPDQRAPAVPDQQNPAPTAPGPAPRRRRTGLIVAAAVVAVVAVGAGSVLGYKTLFEDDTPSSNEATDGTTGEPGKNTDGPRPTDDADADSGGGNGGPGGEQPAPGGAKTEAGWRLTLQDKTVTIAGPKPEKATNVSQCDTVHVDIDNEFRVTHPGNIDAADYLGALAYHACAEPEPEEGLQATDGSIMNTVTAEFPTPSACLRAARDSSLPNPVPLDELRDDSVLKKGVGLCVETADKAVAHLWIRKVNRDTPDSLPTYLTTATLWEPEK